MNFLSDDNIKKCFQSFLHRFIFCHKPECTFFPVIQSNCLPIHGLVKPSGITCGNLIRNTCNGRQVWTQLPSFRQHQWFKIRKEDEPRYNCDKIYLADSGKTLPIPSIPANLQRNCNSEVAPAFFSNNFPPYPCWRPPRWAALRSAGILAFVIPTYFKSIAVSFMPTKRQDSNYGIRPIDTFVNF